MTEPPIEPAKFGWCLSGQHTLCRGQFIDHLGRPCCCGCRCHNHHPKELA